MALLKQLSLAAVFAASLFFVSDALADEKEKNPFTKEINAVKRAEKRLQKDKNNAARKRAETNLKKEKKALENAVKEETARYEKALKAVEEKLKLKNENEENKERTHRARKMLRGSFFVVRPTGFEPAAFRVGEPRHTMGKGGFKPFFVGCAQS